MILPDVLIIGGVNLLLFSGAYLGVGKYFIRQTNVRLTKVEDFNRHTPLCKEAMEGFRESNEKFYILTGQITKDIAVIKETLEWMKKNGAKK